MWIIALLTVTFLILHTSMGQSQIDMALTRSSCQTKTQVDPAMLTKIRTGDYSTTDKKVQSYAFCIYRSLGVIDDNANLQLGPLNSLVDDSINRAQFQKATDVCNKVTGSDPYEKAFNIVKCFHEQFPEDESDL